MKELKNVYVEPDDYFPDEVLKEFKLGPYNDDEDDDENQDFRDYVNKK